MDSLSLSLFLNSSRSCIFELQTKDHLTIPHAAHPYSSFSCMFYKLVVLVGSSKLDSCQDICGSSVRVAMGVYHPSYLSVSSISDWKIALFYSNPKEGPESVI